MIWLVKSEPDEYGWDDLVRDGVGCWDGVRNVEARNNLRTMAVGELVLFYHSGKPRAIVGIAEVVRSAYPDPSTNRPLWSAVDLKPVRALKNPVSLGTLKSLPEFRDCALVRRARLSVMTIEKVYFDRIIELSES